MPTSVEGRTRPLLHNRSEKKVCLPSRLIRSVAVPLKDLVSLLCGVSVSAWLKLMINHRCFDGALACTLYHLDLQLLRPIYLPIGTPILCAGCLSLSSALRVSHIDICMAF